MSKLIFDGKPIKREGKDFYDFTNVRYEAKSRVDFKELSEKLGEQPSDEMLDALFPVNAVNAPAPADVRVEIREVEKVVERDRLIASYMDVEKALDDVLEFLNGVASDEAVKAHITEAKAIVGQINTI